MASHANSTPAPAPARPATVWRIRGLMEFANASMVAIESEEAADALATISGHLWHRLAAAPITGPVDARGKLEAVLEDLLLRRDIDHLSAGIIRDVIDYLDGVES